MRGASHSLWFHHTCGPVGVIDITKLIFTGGKSSGWGGSCGGWKKPKYPFHWAAVVSHECASAAWVRGAQPGQQRETLIHFGSFSRGPGTVSQELRSRRARWGGQ